MAERDEFELRVVEAMEPLPERDRRERPTPAEHRIMTAHEMLETLKASKGSASVTDRIPMLPEVWGTIAYFDVRGWSGAGASGLTLWDADFDLLDMQGCLDNNFAFFSGAEWGTRFGAPGTTTGRVCCFFKAPRTDYYIVSARLQRLDSLFDETGPAAGFFIDDIPMGELQWQESTYPIDHLLVVSAVQGFHRFDIRQVSGSYHFLSVTIWMSAPEGVDEP